MDKKVDGKSHKPGEVVPQTGIYKIYHDQHRLMHEAALLENTFFPCCKKCRSAVRFVLARHLQARFVLPFRSTELLEECWKLGIEEKAG
ncbi:MAG TPA: hypothetical protein VJA94_21350 [Candidatus Angelobacter sp.]